MRTTRQLPRPDSLNVEWISLEITRQLRELKTQLNREIVEDLHALEKDIMAKVGPMIDEKVKAELDKRAHRISQDVDKKIDAATNKQLAVVNQSNRELADAVGDDVYNRVLDEINEKVVPKVDNMVRWVNYKTQDTDILVHNYRCAVEKQNRSDPSIRLLTDGQKDDRIITQHVRTFFGDSD